MTTMAEMMGRASGFFVAVLTMEMGVKADASWGSGCLSWLPSTELFMAEHGDLGQRHRVGGGDHGAETVPCPYLLPSSRQLPPALATAGDWDHPLSAPSLGLVGQGVFWLL